MHFVIDLVNFVQSIPFSLIIMALIALIGLKLFGSTLKTVLRIILVYLVISFILTAFLGVSLPSIPALFSAIVAWIKGLFS